MTQKTKTTTFMLELKEFIGGYKYSLGWIPDIWAHYKKCRLQGGFYRTSFASCVKATIAIILNLENVDMNHDPSHEVAWRSQVHYMTDYGEGRAWDYLAVEGWRYTIGSDGSL